MKFIDQINAPLFITLIENNNLVENRIIISQKSRIGIYLIAKALFIDNYNGSIHNFAKDYSFLSTSNEGHSSYGCCLCYVLLLVQ